MGRQRRGEADDRPKAAKQIGVSQIETPNIDDRSVLGELIPVWCRLLIDIWRLFRFRIVVLLCLTVMAGIVDGLGMSLLLPLLQLVGVGGGKAGYFVGDIDRVFHLFGMSPSLEVVLGSVVLLYVVQAVIVSVQGQMTAAIETAYVSHWRETLIKRLLGASWQYFTGNRAGSLTYLAISETERLGRTFFLTIQLVAALAVATAFIVVSLIISWKFTFIIFLAFTLLIALMSRFSSRASYSTGRDYALHLGELQTMLTEVIHGAKLIKATAAEPFVLEKVLPINRLINKNYFGTVFIPFFNRAIMEFAAIMLFCVLIYIGIRFLSVTPEILLVLMAIFIRLAPKLYVAQYSIQLLLSYLPVFERIEKAAQEIHLAKEPYPIEGRERGFATCPTISIQGLTVTYDGRHVLSDVSLNIPENSTLGVIGISGAGKSTLVDCLVGLATSHCGSIKLDDRLLKDVNLRQWRSSIGYVAQETVLFDGTIREIICLGRTISDDLMVVAAKQAHAHVFIMELPRGYDTVVGAKGVQLSGGQKQRLSLARALAGQPVMLILDEPTSALDSLSEKEIVAAIQELHGKITIVIISHRISTVRYADKIFVLDKGKIVNQGRWKTLYESESVRRLMQEQSPEK